MYPFPRNIHEGAVESRLQGVGEAILKTGGKYNQQYDPELPPTPDYISRSVDRVCLTPLKISTTMYLTRPRDIHDNGAVLSMTESTMMHMYLYDRDNLGFHKVAKSTEAISSGLITFWLRKDFPWKRQIDSIIG